MTSSASFLDLTYPQNHQNEPSTWFRTFLVFYEARKNPIILKNPSSVRIGVCRSGFWELILFAILSERLFSVEALVWGTLKPRPPSCKPEPLSNCNAFRQLAALPTPRMAAFCKTRSGEMRGNVLSLVVQKWDTPVVLRISSLKKRVINRHCLPVPDFGLRSLDSMPTAPCQNRPSSHASVQRCATSGCLWGL